MATWFPQWKTEASGGESKIQRRGSPLTPLMPRWPKWDSWLSPDSINYYNSNLNFSALSQTITTIRRSKRSKVTLQKLNYSLFVMQKQDCSPYKGHSEHPTGNTGVPDANSSASKPKSGMSKSHTWLLTLNHTKNWSVCTGWEFNFIWLQIM